MARELSIIIPTLDEAETLPGLFADLSAQTGADFEVLVSDGGSTDATREVAAEAMSRFGLDGQVQCGPPGRGRQLNHGAGRARGEWLLFLHADSRLPDPAALAGNLAALKRERNPRLAGHFALRFDLPDARHDFDYYLCEVKARCGFSGTIHGDQGFLLKRAFFEELGGFREDLPVLEDTLLAEAIRNCGRWYLLPATIVTSPRRFQTEGRSERQTLNALLMNFAMTGRYDILQRLPALYRVQNRTEKLQLALLFRMIDALLDELPWRERVQFWYRTGTFVRGNAWQLVLRRAARLAFAAGVPPERFSFRPVENFCHRFDRMTDHPPGCFTAMLLTWIWFRTRLRQPAQGA